MNKDSFLTKDSPKTREMIRKIKDLFFSNEKDNIQLGLQFLKSGGLPNSLLTVVFVLAHWHPDDEIRTSAIPLLKKHQSDSLTNHLKKHWKWHFRELKIEKDISPVLENLSSHPDINIQDLGNFVFKISGKGASFCLKNQTTSPKNILEKLLQKKGQYLSLTHFQLDELPEEIGDFSQLKMLDISGNNFEILPDSFRKLKNLERLIYKKTPLHSDTLNFIRKEIPMIFARKFFDDANHLFQQAKYKDAIKKYTEAIDSFPEYAEAWNRKGYCYRFLNNDVEALFCYKKSVSIDEGNTFAWANMAEALCSLEHFNEALKVCEDTLNNFSQMTHKTTQDESNLWFVLGLVHFWLKNYQKALNANDECLKLNQYLGAWYNKACCFAKLGEKSDMLKCLEKSFEDEEYIKMATKDKDKDFKTYYKDKDFIELKKRFSTV